MEISPIHQLSKHNHKRSTPIVFTISPSIYLYVHTEYTNECYSIHTLYQIHKTKIIEENNHYEVMKVVNSVS